MKAEASPRRLAVRAFLQRPVAVAGLAVIVLFVAVAVLAPVIAPYDPVATSWTAIRKAPSAAHWMGTRTRTGATCCLASPRRRAREPSGRSRFGAHRGRHRRLPAGLLAGISGGWIDAVLSRIVDAMLACPFLDPGPRSRWQLAFLGPDLTNAMIAIGVSTAPRLLRVARAATLDADQQRLRRGRARFGQSTLASGRCPARCCRTSSCRRSWCRGHWPSPPPSIAEASLSFLGLGQQPPEPSWGSMLNSAQRFLSQAPWLAVFPGLAIFLCVLSFNLVGDGLRDALDPRGRR